VTTVLCAPILLTLTDDEFTNDATPTFTWDAVTGAIGYRIQIDNDADPHARTDYRANACSNGRANRRADAGPDGGTDD
jgi:hypothetical protein